MVPGLSVLGAGAHAALHWPGGAPVSTLRLEFVSPLPWGGVLVYAPLYQGPNTAGLFLCVALWGGDVFVVFNQGAGVQPAFRSRGLYLSDGLIHHILLDFSYTNRSCSSLSICPAVSLSVCMFAYLPGSFTGFA